MSYNQNIQYNPPFLLKNKHLNTILPALFRKPESILFKSKRLETNDGDFIDFDLYSVDSDVVAIITHGLEGHSKKPYVKGMVNICNQSGLDAIAVNLRGCSGEPNKMISSYHSGKTDDLEQIVYYAKNKLKYEKIVLIGFSLGGNITLKYVGESATKIPDFVKLVVAVSVPCDLKSSALNMAKPSNWIYLQRFLRSLKKKAIYKIEKFKITDLNKSAILRTKNFFGFDDLFTAPVHGFKNADDYYSKCSCKQFLRYISIPTLIINANDDPFLPGECYPYSEVGNNPEIYFEVPDYGGHVGFMTRHDFKEPLWHEKRIKSFLDEKLEF